MKSKESVFLFTVLLSLNPISILSADLTFTQSERLGKKSLQINQFRCNFTDDRYLLAQTSPPVYCDEEGRCTREPPKSPDVPHIITPQQGMVIDTRNPILRWRLVEGTLAYTIQISGLGVNWNKQVDGEQWWIHYDGPELQAGEEYLFRVNANNGYEPSRETFKVIAAEKAREINAEIDRLHQTISAEEERELAIAKFYRDEGLLIDAIETLETLVSQNSSNSDAYCMLSELYSHLDLD
ncbi:MAG: hypothetical protein AAGA60_14070 [Cyanobacteria bacterium P01_E01_bin.42]